MSLSRLDADDNEKTQNHDFCPRTLFFIVKMLFIMASALKNLSTYDADSLEDGSSYKIAIAVADWNASITHALYEGCFDTLIKHGVKAENIHTVQVPGAFELPIAGRLLATQHNPDAVICIGCVIKGETSHNEYINHSVASALTNMSLALSIPFIYGVLTPNTEEQAKDRAGGKYGNKGVEAAVTALRMVQLKNTIKGASQKIGFGII